MGSVAAKWKLAWFFQLHLPCTTACGSAIISQQLSTAHASVTSLSIPSVASQALFLHGSSPPRSSDWSALEFVFDNWTHLLCCSCKYYTTLLLFCNGKPASSSSQPLLLHLLADKGLHYLQLHGSHQLQNCRYCKHPKYSKNKYNVFLQMLKLFHLKKRKKDKKKDSVSYLRSCPLSSEETSSIWTWSHSY